MRSKKQPTATKDNRSYYDDFSTWYERDRGHGYHQMVDDLEVDLVRRYGDRGRILEVGCGTGLIMDQVRHFADSVHGIDLSDGMLQKARERGLQVQQGSATELPYEDDTFDLTYSFKVLAHVEDIRTALHEMCRVTAPGGYVLAEFYNPRSLRYLIKSTKPPTAVSNTTNDEAVYTRYDTVADIESYLPQRLTWETTRGVRIVTPVAFAHQIPGVGSLLRLVERQLSDLPIARDLGGFLIAVARKQ